MEVHGSYKMVSISKFRTKFSEFRNYLDIIKLVISCISEGGREFIVKRIFASKKGGRVFRRCN